MTVELIDVDEAAELLKMTPRFVRRLVYERKVPFFKIGRYIRFDPADLEDWLKECRYERLR